MFKVDFLRHGELEGGIKYRGCLDDPLTSLGREGMDKVWGRVKPKISKVISSPLSRCAKPAQDWAEEKGLVCILDERIKELSYGDWEGKTKDEITDKYPGLLEAWRTDPTHLSPPSGEHMKAFAHRVHDFWDSLIEDNEGEHILIVGHSGSIRLLLAYALNALVISTRHLAMPYACWSRVEVTNKQAQLLFHNRS